MQDTDLHPVAQARNLRVIFVLSFSLMYNPHIKAIINS